MAGENAGFNSVLKISGTATAMVGEATTDAGAHTIFQITSTTKQVLDKTGTIYVQVTGDSDEAEDDTTTTNLEMTAHGLVTGDLIINTTRSNAKRVVTRVDANNVSMTAISGQTVGDSITKCPSAASTTYTLNRLSGTVTFDASVGAVAVYITGNYLPMSTAAYCNSMSDNRSCNILDISKFGTQYKSKLAGQLSASGTFTQLDITDTTYSDALTAGAPILLENRTVSTDEPSRYWVLLDSEEIKSAVDGVQDETVSWQSTDEWLRLGE